MKKIITAFFPISLLICLTLFTYHFSSAQSMGMSEAEINYELSGRFSIVWGDSLTGQSTTEYFLHPEDGTSIRLIISETLLEESGGALALNHQLVGVNGNWLTPSIRGGRTGEFQVEQIGKLNQPLELSAQASGNQPWITILCKFSDYPTAIQPLSYFQDMYANSYPLLDHYWREQSYNNINLENSIAVGWYTLPQPWSFYNSNSSPDTNLLFDDCVALADSPINFNQYEGINLIYTDELQCQDVNFFWQNAEEYSTLKISIKEYHHYPAPSLDWHRLTKTATEGSQNQMFKLSSGKHPSTSSTEAMGRFPWRLIQSIS